MPDAQPSRRTVVKGVAWAVPAIAVAATVPASAASPTFPCDMLGLYALAIDPETQQPFCCAPAGSPSSLATWTYFSYLCGDFYISNVVLDNGVQFTQLRVVFLGPGGIIGTASPTSGLPLYVRPGQSTDGQLTLDARFTWTDGSCPSVLYLDWSTNSGGPWTRSPVPLVTSFTGAQYASPSPCST